MSIKKLDLFLDAGLTGIGAEEKRVLSLGGW